jgi:6-phosphogluconate dehydrogenase
MKLIGALALLVFVGCGKGAQEQAQAVGSAVEIIDEAAKARARSEEAEQKFHAAEADEETARAKAAASQDRVEDLQKELEQFRADVAAALDAVVNAKTDEEGENAEALVGSLEKRLTTLEHRVDDAVKNAQP